MKQTASTHLSSLLFKAPHWVMIFVVTMGSAFGSSTARAQAQEHVIPTNTQNYSLAAPTLDSAAGEIDGKVLANRNGLQVVAADSKEDLTKLTATDPSELQREDLKEKVGVQTFYDSNSTVEQRKATSPKSILRTYGQAAANVTRAGLDTVKASPKIAGQTLMHFPVEASTFYTAMGLLAAMELNHPLTSKNPAALEQFIHHSFKDPIGAVGFYGFMLVNRQTSHFFQQLSMMGGADPREFGRVKSIFYRHVTPQIGMSAGFMAQTVFTELWHDKEFKMCIGRFGMKKISKIVGGKRITLAPDSPEILEACELAYDRWAVRQKIKDYVPLISAMIVTNILQMSSIPFAKWMVNDTKAGKAIVNGVMRTPGVGAILRPMSLAIRVGKNAVFPQGGLAVRILSMVGFIKGSELVQPYFDKATGMPLKADDIADLTNRVDQKLSEASRRDWQPVRYLDREDERKNDPAELLKKLSLRYQKMREFHLQIPYANRANWMQALGDFQGAYTSSYAMYDRVISEVREYRERGTSNRYEGPNPTPLFLSRESPIYQVGTLNPKKQSGPMASDPLRELLVRIRDYYTRNSKSLNPDQDRVLRQINFGLESAYRDLSATELDAAIKKAKLDSSKMTAEQRHSVAVEVRANRVDSALKLFAQLGSNLKNNSGIGFRMGSSIKGLFNEVAGDVNKLEFNAFIWHLYANLKDLNYVVTSAGYDYYHRELGTNKNIVSDMARESTPKRYQLAYTPTMADYLLASMVCGPRAQGGAAERSKQTTLLSKAMNLWNYNDKTKQTFETMSLIEFTPGFGWRFLPPRLVQDSVADANFCGKIPARSKVHNVATAAQEFVTGRSVEKQNIDLRTFFNVNTGEFKVNDKTHQGMLPLVKHYMRPEFLAAAKGDAKPFFNYWTTNVEPQAKKALLEFHSRYRELVFKDFVPRFTSGEYVTMKGRKVHYGTGWSMRDEGTYYSDLLKRLIPKPEMETLLKTYQRNLTLSIAMFSESEKVRQATDLIFRNLKDNEVEKSEAEKDSLEILAGIEEEAVKVEFTPQQIGAVRTAADPVAQMATVRLLKAIEMNVKAIKEMVEKTALKGSAKNVAEQVALNMELVASEAGTYNGVIRAVNLDNMPEVSDLK